MEAGDGETSSEESVVGMLGDGVGSSLGNHLIELGGGDVVAESTDDGGDEGRDIYEVHVKTLGEGHNTARDLILVNGLGGTAALDHMDGSGHSRAGVVSKYLLLIENSWRIVWGVFMNFLLIIYRVGAQRCDFIVTLFVLLLLLLKRRIEILTRNQTNKLGTTTGVVWFGLVWLGGDGLISKKIY